MLLFGVKGPAAVIVILLQVDSFLIVYLILIFCVGWLLSVFGRLLEVNSFQRILSTLIYFIYKYMPNKQNCTHPFCFLCYSILEMFSHNIETLQSYHCLTGIQDLSNFSAFVVLIGPLMNNLVSEMDRTISKLRMKFKSYITKEVLRGLLMLMMVMMVSSQRVDLFLPPSQQNWFA